MNRRLLSRVALSCGVVLAACTPAATPTPPWHQEAGYRWRELSVPSRGKAGFTTIDAGRSGIRFTNDVSDSLLLGNRILGQGAGIALGDVDGDGLVDVFLARTEGCNALYRNLGDWHFEDVTKSAGVGACDRSSSAAALADIDGDRDLDLILLATTGPNAVFVNDGKGTFTEHRDLGLDTVGKGGSALTLADVDGDGKLELYVANYKAYNLDDTLPPERRDYNRILQQSAGRYEIAPEFRAEYKLVMRPDMGGLRMSMRGAPDELYEIDKGRFTPIAIPSRFRDAQGRALSEAPESFGLSARFVDLDGDGAPELYVANDFEDTDELWRNDGWGNFRLADWKSQRQVSNSSMGVDFSDVDGDGRPDIFVVDMLANDSKRLKTQAPTHTALPKRPGDIETQLQLQRNSLFLNRGDGTFAELASLAGVQASGWSWSAMFTDVDLDGWQDILVANGHLWDIMDADVHERLQNRQTDVNWRRLRWEFPVLRLRNVAFRNRGDLSFEDASNAWRFGTEEDISHALAAADLDGDGDLDVVVNRLRAPALILRNDATSPRIGVRLVGDAPNTNAVGAKIRLLGGATPVQTHEVAAGGLYLSHSDYQAAFAMGRASSAALEIEWRDGRKTVIADVRPNRLYEITAAAAAKAPAREATPDDSVRARTALFADASSQLGGHAHVDPLFDDWARQLLTPNAMSQLGPGIAWFDYDGDGDEDLLVGAGKSGRLGVFRNDRGRLVPQPSQGIVAPADLTTVLGMSSPDGDAQLLLGLSRWEGHQVPSAVKVGVHRGTVGATMDSLVAARPSSTGPMALADYDGDGDLDLFVGGRVIPGRYPERASSALYRNEGGRFVLDDAAAAALDSVGLVSAAVFADVDADGHPDLLLAREWDSILLLLNRGGRFVPAPPSWGLQRWTSRWNGIATGDLDGDGRLDIVATSWGRNTAMQADSARPLLLYYGAFGSAGETESLIGREDPRLRAPAPLNGFLRVRATIPDLATRVRTFAAYGDATVDQVLGAQRSAAKTRSVVTLDHLVLLNRGDHFEARALPVEAQLAPSFYVGVADFDGDGNEDVFLAQNFFPTAVGLPRYDAGRGLLLRGDGKGGLTAVPGQESGILVYGDQRGAAYADFNGDGRLDVAVSQNAAATRLLLNQKAKPGLRVRVNGAATNRDGIGVQLRIVYDDDRMGPVREIQAGSGYWSQNGAVQVFGLSGTPRYVWARWPGGGESRVKVPVNAREVVVSR